MVRASTASTMNNSLHILVVDDQQEICDLVQEYLTGEGYRVSVAHDGSGMRRVIGQSAVDLVLLDVVLPGEDGLMLTRSLRAESPNIGIIMLTGRGETLDRIVGLELGADDYLAKPFHLRELLARVKSVKRRIAPVRAEPPPQSRSQQARFAGWLLDLSTRELFSPGGEGVPLTGGEFGLLATFITRPNQVLSRDRLSDLTRGREAGPLDRSVDVQIGRLRRKLNERPEQPELIKTLRGSGYMFAAPVELIGANEPKPTLETGEDRPRA